MRSHLASHCPSGFTDAELERRRIEAEERAYHEGIVLIRLDDAKIPKGVRDMAEAIGRGRFGPRRTQPAADQYRGRE